MNHPKNSTREFLQLINTFSKVVGYKINSQKINSTEIWETTPFSRATKNIKYFGTIQGTGGVRDTKRTQSTEAIDPQLMGTCRYQDVCGI